VDLDSTPDTGERIAEAYLCVCPADGQRFDRSACTVINPNQARPSSAAPCLLETAMNKKLYVGNLGYDVTGAQLEQLFAEHGTVESATIIEDKETGRSKGFGFVEMSSGEEARAASAALDGKSLDGRAIKVNEAKPRPDTRRERRW
jgi:RNA recognition motif-containing protein